MARYKAIDTSPRFLAVDLEKHLLPGCFEHAVHHLLEHEFDLSCFDTRCIAWCTTSRNRRITGSGSRQQEKEFPCQMVAAITDSRTQRLTSSDA